MKINAVRKPWTKKVTKDGKTTETKMPGGKVSAEYPFAANIQGLISQFTEAVVYNHAMGAFKVAFQGWLRGQLDQGKTQEEITAAAKDWKPGQRKQGKTPQEKLREQFASMSAEDRAALLKELRGEGGGAEATKAGAEQLAGGTGKPAQQGNRRR